MSIEKIEKARIYSSWGDPLDTREIEELNNDLQEMFSGMEFTLSVVYKPDDDGWELSFLKESN